VLRHLICFIDAEPGEAAARRPECARAHTRRRRYGRMAQIAAMHESASGPSVWTGRALQAESDDLEVVGLALLYPALDGTFEFLAIMDIRARSISFASRPRRP